jgi:hypothetical protein
MESDVEKAFAAATTAVTALEHDHRPQATRAALKTIIDLCRAVYEDTPRASGAALAPPAVARAGTEGVAGD